MATKKTPPSKKSVEATVEQETVEIPQTRSKALVFVSHDSRDADIAEAFSNLLMDVSGGTLKSFRSSDKKGNSGIEFGADWYTSIMNKLEEATDVVALLTNRSIDRPWILYEAGVAKGKLDSTVLGLALGVPLEKVSTGPFGQFQNCGDDEDSLTGLVMQLLKRNPDASPREEAIRIQVRHFIQILEKLLTSKPRKASPASVHDDQNVAKLFEEVKSMVRDLPERVDSRVRNASKRMLGGSLRYMPPDLVSDMLFRGSLTTERGGSAVMVLILLTLAKEDIPVLYEIGMDVYRSVVHGDRFVVRRAQKQFHLAMNFIINGPWESDLLRGSEWAHKLSHYLPEMIDRMVVEYIDSLPIRRTAIGNAKKRLDDELA